MADVNNVLEKLQELSGSMSLEKLQYFKADTSKALGISMPNLRALAKPYKNDHQLALELWDTGIHEARILATLVDHPPSVSKDQINDWVSDFKSWDLCDQACTNLFRKTVHKDYIFKTLSLRPEEFVKRTAFSLIAFDVVHDKKATNEQVCEHFKSIERECYDERIYVKKAVNWALRQIGKRNLFLNKQAIEVAKKLTSLSSPSSKWIGHDALRELESKKIQERLNKKENGS